MERRPGSAEVFAWFQEDDILAEMGRLLVALVNAFAVNGYHVSLFRSSRVAEPGPDRPYLRLVNSLPNVTLVDRVPQTTEDKIYLYDREDGQCSRYRWRKRIEVRFDIFASYSFAAFRGNPPILMPYPLHPAHSGPGLDARLDACRKTERRIRVFFSGDTKGYIRNRIHYPASKLTRTEVIHAVGEALSEQCLVVQDEASLNRISRDEYQNRVIMVDGQRMRIPSEQWLEQLSMADFFLCPPGFVMPMCHNAVEAMAVGTIPIINYPEWFSPSLRDMETCVSFERRQDLIDRLTYVLSMKQERIEELRRNVVAYYEDYLHPRNFVRSIEGRPREKVTVLMITDRYVDRNARKLSARSFLLRSQF